MTQGRAPISSGRYVPVTVNGTRQWVRDQVTLQAEILALLQAEGGLPKKRIITAMSTTQSAVDIALISLLTSGHIERYRTMSVRRRMDEHWCVSGQSPSAQSSQSSLGGKAFRANEILEAFQNAAVAQVLKGVL